MRGCSESMALNTASATCGLKGHAFLAFFELGRTGAEMLRVVVHNALLKLRKHAADYGLVDDVAVGEPTADHATRHMGFFFQESNGRSSTGCSHRSANACRSRAHDDHVTVMQFLCVDDHG